jgi:hypothetical protein
MATIGKLLGFVLFLWLGSLVGFVLTIGVGLELVRRYGVISWGLWWLLIATLIVQHFAKPIARAYHLTLGPDDKKTISWNVVWVASRLALCVGLVWMLCFVR